jgi:signal transduction histidine kinase
VTNALRHAQAQHIELRLHLENDSLCLSITDDGVGVQGKPGCGLDSMHARAVALGGMLRIGRAPTGGTSINCVVPRS